MANNDVEKGERPYDTHEGIRSDGVYGTKGKIGKNYPAQDSIYGNIIDCVVDAGPDAIHLVMPTSPTRELYENPKDLPHDRLIPSGNLGTYEDQPNTGLWHQDAEGDYYNRNLREDLRSQMPSVLPANKYSPEDATKYGTNKMYGHGNLREEDRMAELENHQYGQANPYQNDSGMPGVTESVVYSQDPQFNSVPGYAPHKANPGSKDYVPMQREDAQDPSYVGDKRINHGRKGRNTY